MPGFAIAALVAGADGAAASASSDEHSKAACRWEQLRVALQTQGESTTTWIGVQLRHSGSTCALSGAVTLTIEQLGHLARVAGNPLRLSLHGFLGRGSARLLRADWDSWCGSRRGLSLRVHYGRVGVLSQFSHLPACLSQRTVAAARHPLSAADEATAGRRPRLRDAASPDRAQSSATRQTTDARSAEAPTTSATAPVV